MSLAVQEKRLRVLHFARVINRYDFIDVIVRHADPSAFSMQVCTLRPFGQVAPVDYGAVGIQHDVLTEPSGLGLAVCALRLARILVRGRIDIIHTHHHDEALIGCLAMRFNRHVQLILGRHYSDSLHVLPSPLKRRALLGAESLVNRAARLIIVPSRYVCEILTRRQGVRAEKVLVIPYGFEEEKFRIAPPGDAERLRSELGLTDRFVIGSFGRLDEQKGHRFLIEALASIASRVPEGMLILVGDGPMRAALEHQVASLGLKERVRFMGWRRDALRIMTTVDVVAQPTLQEAFSQVMVEALWLGRSLVMTDVGGVRDVVHDGETGIVVPRESVVALAQALEHLRRNPEMRQRLGEAARRAVREQLGASRIVPLYEQAYRGAMGEAAIQRLRSLG